MSVSQQPRKTLRDVVERPIPSIPVDAAVQSGTDERHPDFYSEGLIVIQVENMLYRVDPSHLSGFHVLHNMLDERRFKSKKDKGLFDGNPVRIRDVSKFEFESILRICEAKNFLKGSFSPAEWKAILRLSTIWAFDELRDRAIREIEALKPSPVDYIVLARQCKVDKWVKPAYIELCRRPETLTADEGRALGIDLFAQLCSIRERRCLTGSQDIYYGCSYCGHSNQAMKCDQCKRSSFYQRRCVKCGQILLQIDYNNDPADTEKLVDKILASNAIVASGFASIIPQ